MSSDKRALEKALGNLLGFDDGATDVLDHLLTIESPEDLLEYLSQLLGDDRQSEITKFVDNVGRFNRGESIEIDGATHATEEETQQGQEPMAKQPAAEPEPVMPKTNTKKQKAVQNRKSRVPPPKKQSAAVSGGVGASAKPSANDGNSTDAAKSPPSKTVVEKQTAKQPIKKSRPAKGRATKVCGCFGIQHKALTNCLYCGRIACVVEGYDFCAFCGYMIEEIKETDNHSDDPGWMLKERLLRFDREFARRTQIFDDQADFKGSTTWMDAQEREKAEETERRQLESLKRPKQVLNLAL